MGLFDPEFNRRVRNVATDTSRLWCSRSAKMETERGCCCRRVWDVEIDRDGVQGGPFFLMLTFCSHQEKLTGIAGHRGDCHGLKSFGYLGKILILLPDSSPSRGGVSCGEVS